MEVMTFRRTTIRPLNVRTSEEWVWVGLESGGWGSGRASFFLELFCKSWVFIIHISYLKHFWTLISGDGWPLRIIKCRLKNMKKQELPGQFLDEGLNQGGKWNIGITKLQELSVKEGCVVSRSRWGKERKGDFPGNFVQICFPED